MKRKLLSALLATAMTMTVVAGTGIAVSADGEAVVSTVMFSDPDTMDPGRADDDQKNSIVLECQETLVRLIDGKLTNAGAESYETSDDGLVWTSICVTTIFRRNTGCCRGLCKLHPPCILTGSKRHNAGIFYCIAGGEASTPVQAQKEDVEPKPSMTRLWRSPSPSRSRTSHSF